MGIFNLLGLFGRGSGVSGLLGIAPLPIGRQPRHPGFNKALDNGCEPSPHLRLLRLRSEGPNDSSQRREDTGPRWMRYDQFLKEWSKRSQRGADHCDNGY